MKPWNCFTTDIFSIFKNKNTCQIGFTLKFFLFFLLLIMLCSGITKIPFLPWLLATPLNCLLIMFIVGISSLLLYLVILSMFAFQFTCMLPTRIGIIPFSHGATLEVTHSLLNLFHSKGLKDF